MLVTKNSLKRRRYRNSTPNASRRSRSDDHRSAASPPRPSPARPRRPLVVPRALRRSSRSTRRADAVSENPAEADPPLFFSNSLAPVRSRVVNRGGPPGLGGSPPLAASPPISALSACTTRSFPTPSRGRPRARRPARNPSRERTTIFSIGFGKIEIPPERGVAAPGVGALADETLPTPSAPSHRARARAIGGAVFDSALVALERINPPLSNASPSVAIRRPRRLRKSRKRLADPRVRPRAARRTHRLRPPNPPAPGAPGLGAGVEPRVRGALVRPGRDVRVLGGARVVGERRGKVRAAAGAADAPPASNRASDLETAPRERYATSRVSDDSPVGSIPGTRPSRPARRSMSTSVFSFAVGNTNASADSGDEVQHVPVGDPTSGWGGPRADVRSRADVSARAEGPADARGRGDERASRAASPEARRDASAATDFAPASEATLSASGDTRSSSRPGAAAKSGAADRALERRNASERSTSYTASSARSFTASSESLMNSTLARGSVGAGASPSRLAAARRVRRASFSKSTPPTSTLGRQAAAFAARTTSSDRRTASFASTRVRVPSVSSSSGGNRTAAPEIERGPRGRPETASAPGRASRDAHRRLHEVERHLPLGRLPRRATSSARSPRGRRREDAEERTVRRGEDGENLPRRRPRVVVRGGTAGARAPSQAPPRRARARGADAHARAPSRRRAVVFPRSSPPRASSSTHASKHEPSRTGSRCLPRGFPPPPPGVAARARLGERRRRGPRRRDSAAAARTTRDRRPVRSRPPPVRP